MRKKQYGGATLGRYYRGIHNYVYYRADWNVKARFLSEDVWVYVLARLRPIQKYISVLNYL